jgi:toxin FitB
MSHVVDTCGWLEFFAQTKNAKNFEKQILDTENLIVPTIVLYEVFKKVSLEFDEDKALIAVAHMKVGKVIDISESISIYAAKLSLEKKLPMADALIYATALIHDSVVYTQDNHFEKLSGVKYFKKS